MSFFGIPFRAYAARKGREFAADVAGEGLNDWMTSKVKEKTGVTVKTPPPTTATGFFAAFTYLLGNQTYMHARRTQLLNGSSTNPSVVKFTQDTEKAVHLPPPDPGTGF